MEGKSSSHGLVVLGAGAHAKVLHTLLRSRDLTDHGWVRPVDQMPDGIMPDLPHLDPDGDF